MFQKHENLYILKHYDIIICIKGDIKMDYKVFCSYGDNDEEQRLNCFHILYEGYINIDNKDYFFILSRNIQPK